MIRFPLRLAHYLNPCRRWDQILKTNPRIPSLFMPFSTITQEFPKLDVETLQTKSIFEYQHMLEYNSFANISNEEVEQLLNKCGKTTVNASNTLKNQFCQTIYNNLKTHNKINLNILHTYMNVCTENGVKVNIKEVLTDAKCNVTEVTYKLLLKNLCQNGDVKEALTILELMKSVSIPIDEYVFNNLVAAHAMSGGLAAVEMVLSTMKNAQLNISNETRFSIIEGLTKYSDLKDFHMAVKKYGFKLDDGQLIEIITNLGLRNIDFLTEINSLYTQSELSLEFKRLLKQQCVFLVHMNKIEAVLIILQHFLQPSEYLNSIYLFEEMLQCDYDSETIIRSINILQGVEFDENFIKQIIGLALKFKKYELSWTLLGKLTELRPHYFWPLLLHSHNKAGQGGVIETLLKMKQMNVKFDNDTWQNYVFPFCNLEDGYLLIKNFQKYGFTAAELVGPLLSVLIKRNNLQGAMDICSHYNVKVFGENYLNLHTCWHRTKDSASVISIFQNYCEANDNTQDIVGDFLIKTLQLCKKTYDHECYSQLLEATNKAGLRITHDSADTLRSKIAEKSIFPEQLIEQLQDQVNTLLDFGTESRDLFINHPKEMSLEELECHLQELEAKQMNTRGVLRKLIQLHSNSGNNRRVEELRKQFMLEGFDESVGMKSSAFHTFIKDKNLDGASEAYDEIKESHPSFVLDDYKILDFCALLVQNEQTAKAWDVIKEEAKVKKTSRKEGIKRNCIELLNSFKDPAEQYEMFKFLVDNNYCDSENIILGPLVRIHLVKGDIEKTVETYTDIVEKYKRTPLQFEIMKHLLVNKNDELLNKVLKYTVQVHGSAAAQTTLVAAAAESGKQGIIREVIAKNNVPIQKHLEKRCGRWVTEGKSEPLMTLLIVCTRTEKSIIDINVIIKALMRIFKSRGDVKSISKLYNYLIDNDVITREINVIRKTIESHQEQRRLPKTIR